MAARKLLQREADHRQATGGGRPLLTTQALKDVHDPISRSPYVAVLCYIVGREGDRC